MARLVRKDLLGQQDQGSLGRLLVLYCLVLLKLLQVQDFLLGLDFLMDQASPDLLKVPVTQEVQCLL